MAALDDQFLSLITDIRQTIGQYRITQPIGASDTKNFLPGKGESIYATFLRLVGFVKYPAAINSAIPTEQRIADGQNIVDRLFKPKDQASEARKLNLINFLQSFQQQLEKYVREVGLINLRRIRKQIGPVSRDPRGDSLKTNVTFGKDIAANTRKINEELAKYDQQRDNIGQLVTEIDLLSLFLRNLDSVVSDLVTAGSTTDQLSSQPLGPIAGPFVSLIKAQALGYQQRLETLVNRRVALNSNLILLQQKMRLIRTGLELINKEQIALLSVVNALLYMMQEVKYTCKECRFYSTEPLEGQPNLDSLTEDQKRDELARINQANERAKNFRKSAGSGPGFCTYRVANIPTSTDRSCNEVWGLVNNDYWRASDNAQNGRVDIVTKARDKLDPRKT